MTTPALQPVDCPECGVTFGLPRACFDARVADQGRLFCPNGHGVRLGVASHPDRMIQALHRQLRTAEAQCIAMRLQLSAMTAQLSRARGDMDFLLDANLRLVDENEKLRATVVDRLMGPATAEEGS